LPKRASTRTAHIIRPPFLPNNRPQMVSMMVASQPHARVDQCFLCHQTDAWNDIKGVGWYKHH
jgi:hypothetical protein